MKTTDNIMPFVRLGQELERRLDSGELDGAIARSMEDNRWFTRESVGHALRAICTDMLREETLRRWIGRYSGCPAARPARVGLIMAGNIPLVGFSDLLCVLACGHECLVKVSSKDRAMTGYVIRLIREIEPGFRIGEIGDTTPDALIATGSDNTRRYFESMYPGIPALLRGSRLSAAVLAGDESDEELRGLRDDIFLYYGMGCRNVSRLFVPRGYDFGRLCDILRQRPVTHFPYLNNYRQAKAVRTMEDSAFIDGGFFLLAEKEAGTDNLSEIVYAYYDDPDEVREWLAVHDDRIQCVVGRSVRHPRRVGFGQAQHPTPWDYPDGVDVVDFLLRLSR